MRTICLVLAMVAMLAGAAVAGDTARVNLLDGLYSVDAPTNWWMQEDDGNQGVTLAESANSPDRIIISTPIPGIDDLPGYAELVMKAIGNQMGGRLQVIGKQRQETNDHSGSELLFSVQRPDNSMIGGMITVFDVNGYAVTMTVVGPADGFGDFLAKAETILASYEVDEDALDDNADDLEAIGEDITSTLVKQAS